MTATDRLTPALPLTEAAVAPLLDGVPRTLTVVAVVGTGLVGGVFFAFSTFVMGGLRRLPADQGIAAMQHINRLAPTAPFMIPFLGTAVLGLGLGGWAVRHLDQPGARLVLVGSVLYVVGSVGLTIGYHVPRNDALGRLDPSAPSSAEAWLRYAADWTRANHVRAAASLGAALAFTLALRAR